MITRLKTQPVLPLGLAIKSIERENALVAWRKADWEVGATNAEAGARREANMVIFILINSYYSEIISLIGGDR